MPPKRSSNSPGRPPKDRKAPPPPIADHLNGVASPRKPFVARSPEQQKYDQREALRYQFMGWTVAEIARHLDKTEDMVSRDLNNAHALIQDDALSMALRAKVWLVNEHMQTVEMATTAFENSKKSKSNKQGKRVFKSGENQEGQGGSPFAISSIEEYAETNQNELPGNAQFLSVRTNALKEIAALLGLNAATKIDVTTTEAPPILGADYVAGLIAQVRNQVSEGLPDGNDDDAQYSEDED